MRITIGTRILIALLALLLLSGGLITFISLNVGRSMERSAADASITLADTLLRQVNSGIYARIEDLQTYSKFNVVQVTLMGSNRTFAAIPNVGPYIAETDRRLKAAGPGAVTPLTHGLMENALVQRLRLVLITFYEGKYGYPVFVRTLVTNKYGAAVAMTDGSFGYAHGDEAWWKEARDRGSFVGTIRYDNLSRTNVIDIAVRVEDDRNDFIGVIYGTADIIAIIRDAEIGSIRSPFSETKLMTTDGRLIYSTEAFKPLDDLSQKEFFTNITGDRGDFIGLEGGKEHLFAYVRSQPYRDFPGLDAILVISQDRQSVLLPIDLFRRQVQAASVIVFVIGAIAAVLFTFSITGPITRLRKAAEGIDIGHLDVDIGPRLLNRGDEIGDFAVSFSRMTASLKQSEEALRRAGIYNRSLIEASIDPLVTIGQDGKITDVNHATESATGYTRIELIGTNFADYFTKPESAHAGYRQVFLEGAVRDYPLEIRHKNGGVTPVLYNATVYRNEAGNVIGVFAAARDITEIRKAQERYRESEETLRAYINATTESMMLIDTEGTVIDANDTVCRRFNTTRAQLVGRLFYNALDKDEARLRRQDVKKVIDSARPKVYEDLRLGRSILNTMYPVFGADGKVARIAVFGYDVTDLKRERELRELYEKLRQTADDLSRSNKELEQFAYVASHDLQEPLRVISSYAQLLGKRYQGRLDSDADDFIGYLVDGSSRMQRLIEDLLAYSRVGTRGKRFEPTDCSIVVGGACNNLAAAIRESGARVTFDGLPTIPADGAQLGQLFQNLIGNAIKFRSADAPLVHISAERNAGQWVFSVKDNGIGISPEYRERIFIIFQRLHTREKYPGTGIGLSIAKKIVERHGGTIWVESEPDKGSTFRFTIPDRAGEQS